MIQPIANLYEIQFPIYITKPINSAVTDITIDENIKYLHSNNQAYAYDMILETESTYLGRLMVLNRLMEKDVLQYEYSFTNLAHLIYARPTFSNKSLVIDNLGQIRKLTPQYGTGLCRKYSHRKGSYIFSMSIPTPLQIPELPLLLDSLEEYKPYLELVVYYNTFYFKNILEKGQRLTKTWKTRIM